MSTETIHFLAEAIASLRAAYEAEDEGTVADRIQEAEASAWKAVRDIANAEIEDLEAGV